MRSTRNKWMAALIAAALLAPPITAMAQPGHDELPPGLQKKLQRGEPLPPGWKKKLYPGAYLDRDLYAYAQVISPVDRHGRMVVRIEDETLRLVASTLEIVDILTR